MTASPLPAAPARASAGGAWLGLGIAVRAALCVMSGILGLVVLGVVPLAVDWIASQAERSEVPPEVFRTFDLLVEFTTVLEPYVHLAGGTAIGIGLLQFAAGVGMIAGNESWRRAARALLVADVVHSVAATAWLGVLWLGPLQDLNERYLKSVSELMESSHAPFRGTPMDFQASALLNLVSLGVSLVFSLAMAGVFFWLAGRPFARLWCEPRGRRSTVASGGRPR